jgi:argininosuccinate lyase
VVGGVATKVKQVLRSAFTAPMDDLVLRYVASVGDDRHLLACDVRGSLAHAAMLAHAGVLSAEQAERISGGLRRILDEGLALELEHEDVHMAVERRLEELVGEDARLLHTARSRNDQVALDLRMFVDERQAELRGALGALAEALAAKAETHADVVMPGYTHLQRAQPVLFGHVMLAFRDAFVRDVGRFSAPFVSPLGAGALAGTAVPIDPAYTAELLGASGVFANSIDAVSDRDFAAEFLFACALAAVHLSQLAENLILWCSAEFGFVRLPDELTTGSSIMPQKKNPDCVELVRGRAGQALGELVNMLTTLKGLPFGYNRDLQETKPPVIRAAATLVDSIRVCELAISKMTVQAAAMLDAASDELLFATDVVERLVASGVPFRDAHGRVAEVVRAGRPFSELSDDDWRGFGIDPALARDLTPRGSVASRRSPGGTSPESLRAQLNGPRRG